MPLDCLAASYTRAWSVFMAARSIIAMRVMGVPGCYSMESARRYRRRVPRQAPLARAFEIAQIRRRLVLLGGHQLAVGAEIVRLAADADMRIVFSAMVRVPDRTQIGIAGGLLFLDPRPRQRTIGHGDLVIERVGIGFVEVDPLL